MTDKTYREFIQRQASCITGGFSEYLDDGRNLCVAAHVRRGGMSGTASKAPFSCVPLTQTERAHQHNRGELACLMRFTRDPKVKVTLLNASPFEAERIAGEWFDTQVEHYRALWLAHTGQKALPPLSRHQLGIQS